MRKSLDIPGLFKQFISLPQITQAHFLPHVTTATSPYAPVWINTSVKDVALDETRTLQQIYVANVETGIYRPFGYPTAMDTLASLPSPSKRFLATFRTAPQPKNGATPSKVPNYVIEILDAQPDSPTSGRVIYSLPSTSSVHGKILLSGTFGGLSWNSDETALVYMAEPKAEDRKPANYFPTPEEEEKQHAQSGPSNYPIKGTEFEAKEEWGEQMVGIIKPRPFVVRFTREDGIKLHTVRGIPEHLSAGQCIWSGWKESQYTKSTTDPAAPKPLFDEGIYLTIFPNNQAGGRKLGIAFYNTRESKICYLSARYIIDKKQQDEEKKSKEKKEREMKEAEEAARKAAGITLTPEQEQKLKDEEYAKKHEEQQKEKTESHLIILTPNDHSAQNPRLDGYAPVPQLIYTTTDKLWHHCACSSLKTFITLPSTLQQFMKLVEATEVENSNIEITPDGRLVESHAESSSLSTSSPSPASSVISFASDPDLPPPRAMKIFHSNTHEMIPIVQKPKSIHSFPGLWPVGNTLPSSHRFVWNESHIFLVTSWRSQNVILLCCDEDDSLSRLPLPVDAHPGSSMNLYDVDRTSGRIIVGVSSMNVPETLYIGHLRLLTESQTVAIGDNFLPVCIVHKDGTNEEEDDQAYAEIKYIPLLPPALPMHEQARQRLADCQMEIIQVPVIDTYEDGSPQLDFEAVLITPKIDRTKPLPPLIAFPHGGPHGVSTTNFIPHVAFHACVGCSLLYINYRGSTGFGQAALNTLPGKCGDQDVKDCIAAIELVLSRTGSTAVADRSNVHIQGGSHGGFLTTHLIGQYPTLFQTAVARNPVTNMAHNVGTSDIPDWCVFEATGSYDPLAMPTSTDYDRMFRSSPVAYLSTVRTPLLMLLGGVDRRVPMSQALDYIKLLKARGVRTRTLLYPEGTHPISETVSMEANVWISMVMWALKRFDGKDFSLLGGGSEDGPAVVPPASRLVGIELNPGPSQWSCPLCHRPNSVKQARCSWTSPSSNATAADGPSRCEGRQPPLTTNFYNPEAEEMDQDESMEIQPTTSTSTKPNKKRGRSPGPDFDDPAVSPAANQIATFTNSSTSAKSYHVDHNNQGKKAVETTPTGKKSKIATSASRSTVSDEDHEVKGGEDEPTASVKKSAATSSSISSSTHEPSSDNYCDDDSDDNSSTISEATTTSTGSTHPPPPTKEIIEVDANESIEPQSSTTSASAKPNKKRGRSPSPDLDSATAPVASLEARQASVRQSIEALKFGPDSDHEPPTTDMPNHPGYLHVMEGHCIRIRSDSATPPHILGLMAYGFSTCNILVIHTTNPKTKVTHLFMAHINQTFDFPSLLTDLTEFAEDLFTPDSKIEWHVYLKKPGAIVYALLAQLVFNPLNARGIQFRVTANYLSEADAVYVDRTGTLLSTQAIQSVPIHCNGSGLSPAMLPEYAIPVMRHPQERSRWINMKLRQFVPESPEAMDQLRERLQAIDSTTTAATATSHAASGIAPTPSSLRSTSYDIDHWVPFAPDLLQPTEFMLQFLEKHQLRPVKSLSELTNTLQQLLTAGLLPKNQVHNARELGQTYEEWATILIKYFAWSNQLSDRDLQFMTDMKSLALKAREGKMVDDDERGQTFIEALTNGPDGISGPAHVSKLILETNVDFLVKLHDIVHSVVSSIHIYDELPIWIKHATTVHTSTAVQSKKKRGHSPPIDLDDSVMNDGEDDEEDDSSSANPVPPKSSKSSLTPSDDDDEDPLEERQKSVRDAFEILKRGPYPQPPKPTHLNQQGYLHVMEGHFIRLCSDSATPDHILGLMTYGFIIGNVLVVHTTNPTTKVTHVFMAHINQTFNFPALLTELTEFAKEFTPESKTEWHIYLKKETGGAAFGLLRRFVLLPLLDRGIQIGDPICRSEVDAIYINRDGSIIPSEDEMTSGSRLFPDPELRVIHHPQEPARWINMKLLEFLPSSNDTPTIRMSSSNLSIFGTTIRSYDIDHWIPFTPNLLQPTEYMIQFLEKHELRPARPLLKLIAIIGMLHTDGLLPACQLPYDGDSSRSFDLWARCLVKYFAWSNQLTIHPRTLQFMSDTNFLASRLRADKRYRSIVDGDEHGPKFEKALESASHDTRDGPTRVTQLILETNFDFLVKLYDIVNCILSSVQLYDELSIWIKPASRSDLLPPIEQPYRSGNRIAHPISWCLHQLDYADRYHFPPETRHPEEPGYLHVLEGHCIRIQSDSVTPAHVLGLMTAGFRECTLFCHILVLHTTNPATNLTHVLMAHIHEFFNLHELVKEIEKFARLITPKWNTDCHVYRKSTVEEVEHSIIRKSILPSLTRSGFITQVHLIDDDAIYIDRDGSHLEFCRYPSSTKRVIRHPEERARWINMKLNEFLPESSDSASSERVTPTTIQLYQRDHWIEFSSDLLQPSEFTIQFLREHQLIPKQPFCDLADRLRECCLEGFLPKLKKMVGPLTVRNSVCWNLSRWVKAIIQYFVWSDQLLIRREFLFMVDIGGLCMREHANLSRSALELLDSIEFASGFRRTIPANGGLGMIPESDGPTRIVELILSADLTLLDQELYTIIMNIMSSVDLYHRLPYWTRKDQPIPLDEPTSSTSYAAPMSDISTTTTGEATSIVEGLKHPSSSNSVSCKPTVPKTRSDVHSIPWCLDRLKYTDQYQLPPETSQPEEPGYLHVLEGHCIRIQSDSVTPAHVLGLMTAGFRECNHVCHILVIHMTNPTTNLTHVFMAHIHQYFTLHLLYDELDEFARNLTPHSKAECHIYRKTVSEKVEFWFRNFILRKLTQVGFPTRVRVIEEDAIYIDRDGSHLSLCLYPSRTKRVIRHPEERARWINMKLNEFLPFSLGDEKVSSTYIQLYQRDHWIKFRGDLVHPAKFTIQFLRDHQLTPNQPFCKLAHILSKCYLHGFLPKLNNSLGPRTERNEAHWDMTQFVKALIQYFEWTGQSHGPKVQFMIDIGGLSSNGRAAGLSESGLRMLDSFAAASGFLSKTPASDGPTRIVQLILSADPKFLADEMYAIVNEIVASVDLYHHLPYWTRKDHPTPFVESSASTSSAASMSASTTPVAAASILEGLKHLSSSNSASTTGASPSTARQCHFCHTHSSTPLQQCGQCKRVVYCNRVCQKKDWKRHKLVCGKSVTGSNNVAEVVPPASRLVGIEPNPGPVENHAKCVKDVPARDVPPERLVGIETNPGPASAPSTIQHSHFLPTGSINDDESEMYVTSSAGATPTTTPSLHPLEPPFSTLDTLFDASSHFSIFAHSRAEQKSDSSVQVAPLDIPLLTDVVEPPGTRAGSSDSGSASASAGDSKKDDADKLPDGRTWERTKLVPATLTFGLPSWFVLGFHIGMVQMLRSFTTLGENAQRRQEQQFFNGGIDCDGLQTQQCADGAIQQQSVESVGQLVGVLITFLLTPIAGALIDVWGRRVMLLLSAAQTMIVPICLLLRYLTGMSYYITIVMQTLTAFNIPVFYPFVSDCIPPSRSPFVAGIVVAFELIPDVMGPQISPLISEHIAFWLTTGFTTAGLVWTFFFLPETLPSDQRQPLTWRQCSPMAGFRVLTRYVFLTQMGLLVFLTALVQNSSNALLGVTLGVRVPYTAQLQANMQTAAACSILFSALFILPIVSRYFTSRQLLLVVITLTGTGVIGIALLSLSDTLVTIWFSIAELGDLFTLISDILLTKHVLPTEQGVLTGAITSLQLLANSLADLFVAPLSLYWSSADAPFHMYWFPGVLLGCILGCAFLLAYRMTEPSEAERLLAKRLDRHRALIDQGASDEHIQKDIQQLLIHTNNDHIKEELL